MWILTESPDHAHQHFINSNNFKSLEFISKEVYVSVWSSVQQISLKQAEEDLVDDDPDTLYFCGIDTDGSYELMETLPGQNNQKVKVAAIHNAIKEGFLSERPLIDLGAVLSGI